MTSLMFIFTRVLKIGATAYGGPGMIAQIKEAAVKKYGWVTEGMFMRGVALCQLIPGATMVQIVTYIGYRVRGIPGALTAAVAFVLPAFIALLVLSALYFRFHSLWLIQALFKGLGAIVLAIILNACITFGKNVLTDWKTVTITLLSFIAFFFRWNLMLVFVLAAAAGLLLRLKHTPASAMPSGGEHLEGAKGKEHLLVAGLAAVVCLLVGLSYLVDHRIAALSLNLAKIGAVAFGGMFTGIPLMQYELVDRLGLLSTKEFVDGIALGQVTPGPILITATFVGYKVANFLGAAMATLGMFAPSFFILVLLIPYHDRLQGVEKVKMMEQGVLSAFIGMLAVVLYNLGRTSLVDIPSIVIALGAFLALYKEVGLPYILLVGGILSMIIWGRPI
ncbi:MAG: chromate efflux transporter [Deltaproteobacteria bacterium]|nr:chromate efflux transporter [Deltaproteobacteria bacterium]